jgi:hypothetical protein
MTKFAPGSTHVLKNTQGGRLFVVESVEKNGMWVYERASLPSQQKFAVPMLAEHIIPCTDAAMANRIVQELRTIHDDAEKAIRIVQANRRDLYEEVYRKAQEGTI